MSRSGFLGEKEARRLVDGKPPAKPAAAANTNAAAVPPVVQGPFLSDLLGKEIAVRTTSGTELVGILRRFDIFTIVLEAGGVETMLFKHAIEALGRACEEAR